MKQTKLQYHTAIIVVSETGIELAQTIQKELANAQIFCRQPVDGCCHAETVADAVTQSFGQASALIFIGAMGICVRSVAPFITDKYTDPAVINIDSSGRFVIPVLSGHVGGANDLAIRLAHILGAQAVVTTQSDNTGLWPLDTIGKRFGWKTRTTADNLNQPIFAFVNQKPTALLLDINDEGSKWMKESRPQHVTLFYDVENIDFSKFELLIAVTPYLYREVPIPILYFHPPVLEMGMGCRKDCNNWGVEQYIAQKLAVNRIAIESVAGISSIDLKKDEPLIQQLAESLNVPLRIYSADDLKDIEVPNPSEKVMDVTSVGSVSEASAIKSVDGGALILEKQKGVLLAGSDFTFAVAIRKNTKRSGHIEIVGAGPGDPELVSVRGKRFLEKADLILYAGSLVPIELTHYAKSGATVRSSASMNLEEQFAIMKDFYDRGMLIVRLHTGDPCIYGAIQEQMALFDNHEMSYHITPGISSFQAAAAALHSQFTIPEKTQTIILTRGEGRTPMPEKEKLSLLARSQSTMCIFLSATVADQVQRELIEHYPPTTPVAACYKLTWKDERIYRGELQNLAQIIKDNNLTLTTMIVVGEAINNRQGLSRLYADEFKHLFRT